MRQDLSDFTRRIRLAEYFRDTENTDDSLVRNQSMFTPPMDRNPALNSIIKSVEKIPLANQARHIQKVKSNINRKERIAIKSLSSVKNIIIKEAVVIMDSKHYKKMAENILNDNEYYETLQNNPLEKDRINYNRQSP